MYNILFGYACTPSFGCFGETDGGFSVEVYGDCSLVYRSYLFDGEEQFSQEYPISRKTLAAIKKVMKENQEDINMLPDDIDNGSLDGDCNTFILNGKEVSVCNIDCYREVPKNVPADFVPIVKQEMCIMEIFDRVAHALEKEGMELSLDEFSIS